MTDRATLGRLRAIGLNDGAVEAKAELFDRAVAALNELRPGDARERRAFWIPGRVEFLGKHTDYAGGRSLLCAVDRGICLVALKRSDRRFRIVDVSRPDDTLDSTLDAAPKAGHWSTYPLTVARRLTRNFTTRFTGVDIAFASDLPVAAGLSSSSALVVATFLALADANGLTDRDEYRREIPSLEDLAGYLGAVENGLGFGRLASDAGVGTFGGSEDHTAILCGEADALVQYSFRPVRFERSIPFPRDHSLVIASSGIAAEKIGAVKDAYNRLSEATTRLLARWNAATKRTETTLAAAVAAGAAPGNWIEDAGWLRGRLEQFVLESTRIIPRVGDALVRGDLAALGPAVDESQVAAERFLENQIPETKWLQRDARANGAVAASAFGAGFGGSVWALVPSSGADAFSRAWGERYAAAFPVAARSATFFVTRPGPPATRL